MGIFTQTIQSYEVANRYFYGKYDKFFHDVCNIINESDNDISSDDLDELFTVIIRPGCRAPIRRDTIGCFKLITNITKKYQLSKKALTKIVGFIKKNNNPNCSNIDIFDNFKWVDNLIKLNVTLTPLQNAALIDAGYIQSLETIMKYPKLSRDVLKSMMSNQKFLQIITTRKDSLKKLINKFNLEITEEIIQNSIKSFDIDKSDIEHFKLVLSEIEKCGYKLGENELIYSLDRFRTLEKISNTVKKSANKGIKSGGISNTVNSIVGDLIQLFQKKGVKLNFNFLTNFLTNFLDKTSKNPSYIITMANYIIDNFIKDVNIDEDDMNKLIIFSRINDTDDFPLKLLETKCVITEKIVSTIIKLNNEKLIDFLISKNKINLMNTKDGFKYACINNNITLIKYYMNQKIIPDTVHLCYLYISGNEIQNQILKLFVSYGLELSQENYEIFTVMGVIDDMTENSSIKDTKVKNNINQLKKKIEFKTNYEESYKRIKKSSINDPMNKLRYDCVQSDLTDILAYIHRTKIIPDIICLENALSNEEGLVFMYLSDEYKYKPDIFSIMKVQDFKRQFLLMKIFYPELIKITYDDNFSSGSEKKQNAKLTKKIIVDVSSDSDTDYDDNNEDSSSEKSDSDDSSESEEIVVKKIKKDSKPKGKKTDYELINLE